MTLALFSNYIDYLFNTYLGRIILIAIIVLSGYTHPALGIFCVFLLSTVYNTLYVYEPFKSPDESGLYLTEKQMQHEAASINSTQPDPTAFTDDGKYAAVLPEVDVPKGYPVNALEGYNTLDLERNMYGKNSNQYSIDSDNSNENTVMPFSGFNDTYTDV